MIVQDKAQPAHLAILVNDGIYICSLCQLPEMLDLPVSFLLGQPRPCEFHAVLLGQTPLEILIVTVKCTVPASTFSAAWSIFKEDLTLHYIPHHGGGLKLSDVFGALYDGGS